MGGSKAEDGRSRALLIAADQFQDPGLARLRSPAQDVQELAEVLRDPLIGGYSVRSVENKPTHVVSEEIEGFFADARLNDRLLLYLSCHGVKDPAGHLYFTMATTKLSLLDSTGISSEFVSRHVDRCRSRRIVVLLDCCYSGAYLRGHRHRGKDRASLGSLEPGFRS